MNEFTVEEGIRIQSVQLSYWKNILKEEVYLALEEFAKRENTLAKSGLGVKRGSDLDNYISNYMLGHRM